MTVNSTPEVEQAVKWLLDELQNVKFGTCGLNVTMHGGRVSKISRSTSESMIPAESKHRAARDE